MSASTLTDSEQRTSGRRYLRVKCGSWYAVARACKLSECLYRANKADPSCDTGKLAITGAIRMEAQLHEIVPPTVTLEWCGRLRRRLQARTSFDVVDKYGGAGGDVGNADNVPNVENNRREDVRKAMAGLWLCRSPDTASQCDEMGAR